jgi:hypothetical protein
MTFTLAALFLLALSSAGCLVKEKSDTLCLEPDGSVRWTIVERDIHAVADTPADRMREESEFMGLVARDEHDAAVAFRALGGTDIRTLILSADWPFAVSTEARFADLGRLWQRYFDLAGVHATSRLLRDGNRTTWTLVVDSDQTTDTSGDKDSKSLSAMTEQEFAPVLMMRHGEFVDASGFIVDDDGRTAKLDTDALSKRDWEKEPRLVLSLTWVDVEAIKAPKR